MNSDKSTDAAIAQALAKDEQEKADAELASRLNSNVISLSQTQNKLFRYPGQRFSNQSAASQIAANETHAQPTSNFHHPIDSPISSPFSDTGSDSHMCFVPCTIGDSICIEMMIDSGATMSVMSLPLAKRLGLDSRIDRSQRGIAAGVGRANIVGKIWSVICKLGQVEFIMNFMVLDVREQMLLLGLDQLKKFKCLIDLEREVLVFGGAGGVEVPMLPADQNAVDLRQALGNTACVTM